MNIYCKFKRKKPWKISTEMLLAMPHNSFGYQLGMLLNEQGFQLIPKVERHDAYHLLTGYSTAVEDEIALQYCCLGNGKRTPYLFGVILIGTFLLPDYLPYYIQSYQFGKQANAFHHFDFKKILPLDFEDFKHIIFYKTGAKKPQLKYA